MWTLEQSEAADEKEDPAEQAGGIIGRRAEYGEGN